MRATGALTAVVFGASIGLSAPVWAETFQFTLANDGKTSAGIFTGDGTLVKTLWSGVSYRAGTYAGEWDGTDDYGALTPPGTYQARVLTSQATYTWEGVIGNTSTASSGPTVFHFMMPANDMAIAGEIAYFATAYEEGISSQARFSVSDPGAKTDINHKGAQFFKVATDGTNVYWAGNDPMIPGAGFVTATVVGTDEQVAFPSATDYLTTYGSYFYAAVNYPAIDVVPPPADTTAEPTGLAVQRTHPYLFVARKGMDSLHIVDKTSGALVHNLTFTAPGDLAVDADDNLWMIHTSGGSRVVQRFAVAADGSLSAGPAIADLVEPLAVASNGTLLVVDGGSSQQVKAFDAAGAPLWTLGRAGGYASDLTVADDKFDFKPNLEFTKDTFVAFQGDGSFWVGDTGCYRMQHFTASRGLLESVSYLPSFYSAAVDPHAPNRVFANYLEFQVEYDRPLAPNNHSWKLVRNWRPGVPVDYDNQYGRMKYVTTLSGCSKPGGCTYATVGGRLFELPPSGPVRDTGLVIPATSSSLTADGAIRSISGSVVQTWTQKALLGFDANDNPRWGDESTLASTPIGPLDPAEWSDGNGLRAGVMSSSGVILSFDPRAYNAGNTLHRGWHLGGVRQGTTNWLWKASYSTPITYMGDWPTDGTFDIMNGVGNAGGVIMAIDRHVLYGYRGENWKGIQTNKFRHYYDDGLFVDEFGATSWDEHNAEAGPELAGNAFNASVIKLSDGRVYLYHNDDNVHGGVHRWRIDGLDTVAEQTTTINWQQDLQPGLLGEYFDTPDWNSANRKSSTLTGAINFDWAGSPPSGSGLTHGDLFSARWSGFVSPQYTETYTFEVDSGDWARLWVDGKQVLAGPGVQIGTAALTAGTYVPVRLEYRHDTAPSGLALKWSSASVPTEVVPSNRLAWAAPGIDLEQGLPATGPVTTGTAGWTRSPETDHTSEYFHYWSVTGQLDGSNPFLSVQNRESTPGTVKTVTRDLGAANDSTARWEINMRVSWYYVNHDPYCGQRIEVLDDAGKVVANFDATLISYPDDVRIKANGAAVADADLPTMQDDVLPQWQPLRITAENGQITFEYGGYAPVTTSIVDPTANWRRIKTFRLYYWTDYEFCSYPSWLYIDGLRVKTTQGGGTADDLLAGIPASGPLTTATAGWTRSPATDDSVDYFHMWTVDTLQDASGPYLGIMRREIIPSSAEVRRDLPMPGDTSLRWDLSMNLQWNWVNHDPYCGQQLKILDDAGRVVANLDATLVAYPDDARLYGNGATLVQADSPTLQNQILAAWRPLHITGENGQITFQYGDYAAVTTPIVDAAADWRRIKTFLLYYWTNYDWCGYPSGVNLRDLRLDTTGAQAPIDLLEGIPAASHVASGEYGWSFTPSLGAKWDVTGNRKAWQTSPPVDIGVDFSLGQNSSATLSRDLGTPHDETTRWQLSGRIRLRGRNNSGGGQYLDVLDDAGKIIARFYFALIPAGAQLYGNTAVIMEGDLIPIMEGWSPFEISAEGGKVAFRYGDAQPVTDDMFDSTAAWQRAKTLRLQYSGTSVPPIYSGECYLDDLQFTATR